MPLLLAAAAFAADFDSRWNEMRRTATPRQLYALLWDLPKGGDIHNHFTLSYTPEMWYRAATDPARTHGNEFYTRTRFLNCPAAPTPCCASATSSAPRGASSPHAGSANTSRCPLCRPR